MLMAGALFLSGPIAIGQGASTVAAAEATMLSIPVEGMSCVSCAAHVKRTVKAIDGVSGVEVDLVGRAVRLVYDPAIASPQQVADAITALGYRAGAPAEAK